MKNFTFLAICSIPVVFVGGLSIWSIVKSFEPKNVYESLISKGFRVLSTDENSVKDDHIWKQKINSIPNAPVIDETKWSLLVHNIKTAKLICADLMTISVGEETYSSGFNVAKDYCSVPV